MNCIMGAIPKLMLLLPLCVISSNATLEEAI